MAVKDWRGTTIKVGSTVVYPTRSQGRMWMTEGTVVSVAADAIGVQRTRASDGKPRLSIDPPDGTHPQVFQRARTSYPLSTRITVV